MRVLGVDPGLTRCGLGVVDGVPGRPPSLVAVGVVRTPPERPVGARLLDIERAIGRAQHPRDRFSLRQRHYAFARADLQGLSRHDLSVRSGIYG